MSDREIARICAVSDKTASSVRMEITAEIPQLQTRIGADGKERRMPTRAASDGAVTAPRPEASIA